eukprot:3000-Heterococcus_DN1.PRE.1
MSLRRTSLHNARQKAVHTVRIEDLTVAVELHEVHRAQSQSANFDARSQTRLIFCRLYKVMPPEACNLAVGISRVSERVQKGVQAGNEHWEAAGDC